MSSEREFSFSDRNFQFVRRFVFERTGISLSEAKRELVYGRLSRRIRKLGLTTFDEYCARLESGDDDEAIELANAITTNVTSFFREGHHFEYLASTLLPDLLKARASDRRIRIWSAGCSSGQEPYTIAMVVQESLPARQTWDVKILATDLDRATLERGRRGVYAADKIDGISAARRDRFLRKTPDGAYAMDPALRAMVRFNPLNLMHEWPMRGPFDCIFCRNVVIYFNKETQRALFSRFAELLCEDGTLFIGHSESLMGITDDFRCVDKSVYRKVSR